MDISSFSSSLASQATEMKTAEIMQQLSVAVMKQIQDQQARQGQALVAMISQSPTIDGTGKIVNVAA